MVADRGERYSGKMPVSNPTLYQALLHKMNTGSDRLALIPRWIPKTGLIASNP
jgi:hypothetical protein